MAQAIEAPFLYFFLVNRKVALKHKNDEAEQTRVLHSVRCSRAITSKGRVQVKTHDKQFPQISTSSALRTSGHAQHPAGGAEKKNKRGTAMNRKRPTRRGDTPCQETASARVPRLAKHAHCFIQRKKRQLRRPGTVTSTATARCKHAFPLP